MSSFFVRQNDEFIFKEKYKKEMLLAFANTNEKQSKKSWQKSSAKKEKVEKPSLEQVKEYFKKEEYFEGTKAGILKLIELLRKRL